MPDVLPRAGAALALMAGLAGCEAPTHGGGGAPDPVVTPIAAEPRPHIFPESLGRWPNGDLLVRPESAFVTESPALRVSGAADEAAARTAADAFCGGALAVPPELGGVPVRFDPPTGEFVLYATC